MVTPLHVPSATVRFRGQKTNSRPDIFLEELVRCVLGALTLLVDEPSDRRGEVAEVWSVHLALHNTNPNSLVEGPTLVLASVHCKVRRSGYRKTGAS